MRKNFRKSIALSLGVIGLIEILAVGGASARLDRWVVGNEEHPWGEWGTSEAIDDTVHPGSIQPVESHGEINILQTLSWTAGKPKDFEKGGAHVWDNAAIVGDPLVMVDGNDTTSTGERFKRIGDNQTGRTFFFDLGSPRSVDRIVFYPRQEGQDEEKRLYREDYLKGFELFINDGSPERFPEGQPDYRPLRSIRKNTQSIVDLRFSLQPIRIVKLRSSSPYRFEIAEFEMYGSGFASKAVYLSRVIDIEEIANFGKLEWAESRWRRLRPEGLKPEGSEAGLERAPDASVSVRIETKSGTDDTPLVYLSAAGDTVSKSAYNKLRKTKQGPITEDLEDWSLWSLPHSAPGGPIISPGPRRYFQFRVTFRSESVNDMARIDSLGFQFAAPPVADIVEGEVAVWGDPTPARDMASVRAGEPVTLTYDLRATMSPGQTGFDGLEIATPSQAIFKELQMGDPLVPLPQEEYEEDTSDPTRLVVRFPSHKITDSTLVRVVFDTAVLVFGTTFTGKVFDTELNELPQIVEPGNANDEVSTDNLRVLVSKASLGGFIGGVEVTPEVMTPNGDGVNDETGISYTLLQLTGETPVTIVLYDLSGRRVRNVYSANEMNGKYDQPIGPYKYKTWDGRDEDGDLVPPGIYLYKISVDTDAGSHSETGRLAVVY